MTKYILVTGAHSGIGYHAAKLLNHHGFKVITTVRYDTDKQLVSDFSTPIVCDLASQPHIDKLVTEVVKITNGNLWGIFNNAAYGQPGALMDLPENVLMLQLDVNLVSQHSITRKLVPFMIGQPGARIVFNSSVLGITHMPLRGAYTMSKFALEALASTYRIELAKFGIHVSVMRPGPIATNFKANALKAFKSNINASGTMYSRQYEKMVERLESYHDAKVTSPLYVAEQVVHAFTAKRPKNYYRSTINTIVTECAIRFLPSCVIDKLISEKY